MTLLNLDSGSLEGGGNESRQQGEESEASQAAHFSSGTVQRHPCFHCSLYDDIGGAIRVGGLNGPPEMLEVSHYLRHTVIRKRVLNAMGSTNGPRDHESHRELICHKTTV